MFPFLKNQLRESLNDKLTYNKLPVVISQNLTQPTRDFETDCRLNKDFSGEHNENHKLPLPFQSQTLQGPRHPPEMHDIFYGK